jgi:hypothetical protein
LPGLLVNLAKYSLPLSNIDFLPISGLVTEPSFLGVSCGAASKS